MVLTSVSLTDFKKDIIRSLVCDGDLELTRGCFWGSIVIRNKPANLNHNLVQKNHEKCRI